jgi:NAD(P)-dependent dehydrogenase (short-subunit alcohol dehydrogenase family)
VQSNKIALITGAAKRVGRAIAKDLSANGFTVIIHANTSLDAAEALAVELRSKDRVAFAIGADLSDSAALDGLMERAAGLAGPIDLLVNNASIFEDDEIGALDTETWDRHFALHLKAPVFLAEAMSNRLPEGRQGLVVNMVDQRVRRLTPKFFSYTLSKSALWTATQTMAMALAPHIRVNAIGPGPTLKNQRQSDAEFRHQAEAVVLEHGPELGEFGATVRYFWDNGSITGQMIALDGGQHLAWETPDVIGE